MRTIEFSASFKRDFKRVKANSRHAKDFESVYLAVITQLVTDQPLPDRNRDHALIGDWVGYRECHLKPDLLLIYRKTEADVLRLARIGSHSELFG